MPTGIVRETRRERALGRQPLCYTLGGVGSLRGGEQLGARTNEFVRSVSSQLRNASVERQSSSL